MRRVNLQVDGWSIDSLIVSCYSRCFVLNFPLHILKLCKSPIGNVMKLGPFRLRSYTRCCMRFWCIFLLWWHIDELQNEGSAGHDPTTTGKEVSADNILEYRGLPRRLGTNDYLEIISVPCLVACGQGCYTICGRSKLSLPIVLKTRSCSLLTIPSKSSPRAAIVLLLRANQDVLGGEGRRS